MARFVLMAAVLLVLALTAYAPALDGGPVWDDHLLLEQNPTIRGETSPGAAFLQPFTPFPIYYRPVTALAIRTGAPGPDPSLGRLHRVSLLLHVGVSLGIAVLARWAGAARIPAGLAALLFLLHPALTEAVIWMSGLGDLLAATALVWGAAILLGSGRSTGPPTSPVGRVVLATLLVAVAVFSKEAAILVPSVLWIALWRTAEHRSGPRRGGGRPRRTPHPGLLIGSFVGIAIVLVVYLGLRERAVPHGLGVLGGVDAQRSILLLGTYTQRLVFPTGLDLHPVIDTAGRFDARYAWAALAAITCVVLVGWALLRRQRALLGIGWFLVAGVPTWLFVPPSSPLFAERYLYLPSIGLAVALAVLATDLARAWLRSAGRRGRYRSRRRVARIAVTGLAVAIGLLAFLQTRNRASDWASEESILEHSLRRDARNVAIAVNRGFLLRTSGQSDAARALYRRTIRAVDEGQPFYWTEHGELAWSRLLFEAGTLSLDAGDDDEAELAFRRVLEVDPAHERALGNLGALLGTAGRLEEAAELLDQGVASIPGSILLRRNLAQALALLGRFEEARKQYRAILSLDPQDTQARVQMEQLPRLEGL